jgi:hypothetical protein
MKTTKDGVPEPERLDISIRMHQKTDKKASVNIL